MSAEVEMMLTEILPGPDGQLHATFIAIGLDDIDDMHLMIMGRMTARKWEALGKPLRVTVTVLDEDERETTWNEDGR